MRLGKKWLILIPTVVMAATAFVAWPYLPKRYQSEVTIVFVPQDVPERYVTPIMTEDPEARWDSILARVLSRTNLVRVIGDLKLYPTEGQRMPMQEVVEKMRGDVHFENDIGDAFRVAYISTDPEKAQRVTRRLARLILEADKQDRRRI